MGGLRIEQRERDLTDVQRDFSAWNFFLNAALQIHSQMEVPCPVMKLKSRKGDSSILTTLLLTSVVIAIGIVALSTLAGTNSIRESDYFDQTLESVQKIEERFCIENIGVVDNGNNDGVTVWVYNYGRNSINITIIRVSIDATIKAFTDEWKIDAGSLASKTFQTNMNLAINTVISVEVSSSRGNKANDVTKIQSKT